MICLKYQPTKPFQEQEPRSFKAESVIPGTKSMASMAPQCHFAAEFLAKLSNTELSACMGAVLI